MAAAVNKDRCTPETDAVFRTRLQAECGVLSAADNYGTLRSVACSPGCDAGSQCSNNQCVCVPETDAQICAASGVAGVLAYRIATDAVATRPASLQRPQESAACGG